jgi:hypothetical protein
VLAGVSTLRVIVDNDEAGLKAATECSDRWEKAGRTVRHAKPDQPGCDFNDVIMAEAVATPAAAPASALVGLTVQFSDPCQCGEHLAMISEPAALKCRRCGAARGAVSDKVTDFLKGIVRNFGAPEAPIIFRGGAT